MKLFIILLILISSFKLSADDENKCSIIITLRFQTNENAYTEALNKINQSLRSKGIDSKYVMQSINKIKENQIEPDFVSALKLCKRRRIGPLRPESNRELFYKKDMGILARGGFSFDLSKRVLDLEKTEFSKLVKII